MKPLSDKTAGFTDSVIRQNEQELSNQYGAINFCSQGFPDFDPPKEMAQINYPNLPVVEKPSVTVLRPAWGSQTIREALARKQKHFSGMDVDPNQEIVVTCGGTEAMMAAMLTVCNPGDKVVVFSPFYENYGADAILSGAEPIYVPLVPPAFSFNPDVLEDAFQTAGCKGADPV